MKNKVALEEHVALERTVEESRGFSAAPCWRELRALLLDRAELRLREMDRHGIEWMALSLNSPTVQAVSDPAEAETLARVANDALAEMVRQRPDRFVALGSLPMQDPDRACRELGRVAEELNFSGVMVNGFSQTGDGALYYDLPRFRPFWRELERRALPFYLHPRNPLAADARIYDGHAWLYGPAWAFGQETAVHALRLMGSGLFDECPGIQVILGHMGEGLPYNIWRVDHATEWTRRGAAARCPARRTMTEYLRENFHITTSGNFSTPVLRAAIEIVGADRILFSTDWPFEEISAAATWFDTAPLDDGHRRRIGRDNAVALLRIR